MCKFSTMILAAGFGSRMKNLTKNIPKPLLKINKTTLLSNSIDFFQKLGCEKFIINTHYLNDVLSNYINIYHKKKNIILINEPQILDTGGGIKNAIKYFDNKNFLVTNADIFWNESNIWDIKKFINKINYIKHCCLLISKSDNTKGINKNKGDFVIKNNYLKKWGKNNPIIFYSGLQILNPAIFDNFTKEKFSINEIWDNLIQENKLQGMTMESNLLHIGDLNTYKKFCQK